jgi:hypothetical protein
MGEPDVNCLQCRMLKLENLHIRAELNILKERDNRFLQALLKICNGEAEAVTVAKEALGFGPTSEPSERAG